MRQIILDTETTGLEIEQGHKIIEIGCVELINRKLTGQRYHQYINPKRTIENDAVQIHGITNDFLNDKPIFAEIADELIKFINGAELIIHNAPFDIGFLNNELKLANISSKPIHEFCKIIDTLVLAKQLHIGQRNSLDALCKRYQVDNSHRELHGALLDAHLLAQVYLAMTGGQSSLFGEAALENLSTASNITIKPIARVNKNLIVLKADESELAIHSEYLQKMQAKNKCLWLE